MPADQQQPREKTFWQRVYAFLFRFLGPAQVDTRHPTELPPSDSGYPCPVCGRPMGEHEYRRTETRTRVFCPTGARE